MRIRNAAVAVLAGIATTIGGLTAPAWTAPGPADGRGDPGPQPPVRSSERLISQPFKIPAPSLANNLLGDRAELSVAVWLPTDYDTSHKRYRTVYYLAGFGDRVDSIVEPLGETTHHPGDPFIIVAVDGVNALGGSFYRNSPITGNWADAITKDLVGYVDTTYRTVPRAATRAIAGHSMGGYGALQLAMDHPDIFGAVDALSPGAVTDQGMKTTQAFDNEKTIRKLLATLDRIRSGSGTVQANFLREFETVKDDDAGFGLAYGAALAPDPSSRTWIRFPYTEVNGALVEDPAVMASWNNGFGNWREKVHQRRANLARLRGLRFEYGTNDEYRWLPEGCRYLDRVLTDAKVRHQTVEFVGNHDSRDRFASSALPYLSTVVAPR